jgi:DNA repair exonuclease SbcCD ATPase subunit
LASGDQSAITEAYSQLFEGIIQKQGEFYTQLDKASAIAKAAGLSIFGINGDTEEELKASIDVMQAYLNKLQESINDVNVDALREELGSIEIDTDLLAELTENKAMIEKEIKDLKELEEEARWKGEDTLADQYSKEIEEKQRNLREILAEMEEIQQKELRIADIENQISEYEFTTGNIELVRQRIAEMEKQLDDYVGTLAYYDEKIAGINADMKSSQPRSLQRKPERQGSQS